MAAIIRLATPEDGGGMQAIYAPLVVNTTISFETEPPTAAEMGRRIAETLPRFPWLVLAAAEKILGYTYACRHRDRTAYRWAVEVSVFVREDCRRFGAGHALYMSLFKILELQGFLHAYAGITVPNFASERFHWRLGFRPVGVYRKIGFKLGRWRDVRWYHRPLGRLPNSPPAPVELAALDQDALKSTALAAGLSWLEAAKFFRE